MGARVIDIATARAIHRQQLVSREVQEREYSARNRRWLWFMAGFAACCVVVALSRIGA